MATIDDALLDFDYGRLAGQWTAKDARQALERYGEVYRGQLVAAHFAERWCNAVLADDGIMLSEDRRAGFEHALRDMAAHLRQGDFLPDGVLYREETAGGG